MASTKSRPITTPLDDASQNEAHLDREHILRIADAVDAADQAIQRHLHENGLPASMPTELVRMLVAQVFIILASRSEQGWAKSTWMLLEKLALVQEKLDIVGPDCVRRNAPWPSMILPQLWIGVVEGAEYARNPPPVQPPFERQLESIKELQEQRVSSRQICIMYDWYTPQGEPDTQRLRQTIAEKGLDFAPSVVVTPGRDPRQPLHRPAVGCLFDFAETLAMYLDTDSPMPVDEAGTAA